MKFSACTAALDMAGPEKIIDTSAELEYDTVELITVLHLSVESTPEHREEVLGWVHDARIVCNALHYIFNGTIRFLGTGSEMMNQSVAYLRQVVGVAYDVKCPTVIVGSSGKTRGFESDWDREVGVKCMAEVIYRVGLYAQEKGVTLAAEAINRYETNFSNTLGEAVNFVNMVNLPSVRTMAGIYRLSIEKVNPAETIRSYGYTLTNLYLADSNRQVSGDERLDFASVAEALWEVDFRRYCSLEVFGLYSQKLWYDTFEESAEHMGNDIKYTRSIFG